MTNKNDYWQNQRIKSKATRENEQSYIVFVCIGKITEKIVTD